MNSKVRARMVTVTSLLLSFGAQAQKYTVVDLGTLGGPLSGGLPSSYGFGINASGQITGYQ